MKLTYILAFASVLIFWVFFFFSKNPRRFYILFIFFFFPLIDLAVTPPNWGSFKVFDVVSYTSCLVLIKNLWQINKRRNFYLVLFSLLILSLLMGSLNSGYVVNSLTQILSIFPIFIFSKSLIDELVEDKKFQKQVIWCLKFIAVFSIAFLIMQIFIGLRFTFYIALNSNTEDISGLRFPSFFPEPQKFGHFLAMVSFIFLINNDDIKSPNFKNYVFFGIMIIGIAASGGRSAFLGLFTGIVLLFFLLSYKFKSFIIGIAVIASVFILNFSNSLVVLNRTKHFDKDFSFRASLWDEAFNIYKKHFLLGIGTGNFKKYTVSHSDNYYVVLEDNEVVFFDQPESGYLMILAEIGTIGFLLTFLLIMTPILSAFKAYNHGKKNLIVFFFIAGIFSWLISFSSVYSLYDKRILIVLITLISLVLFEDIKELKYGN